MTKTDKITLNRIASRLKKDSSDETKSLIDRIIYVSCDKELITFSEALRSLADLA